MDKQTAYCRNILGPSNWDTERITHAFFGHGSHDFTHKSWKFGKEKQYHCPGVPHVHDWKHLGVVTNTNGAIRIVEGCRNCTVERARALDIEGA